MYSVSLVAAPAQITKTPVAKGSSVPACPKRVSEGNMPWSASMAAREVIPKGLSTTNKPWQDFNCIDFSQ
jgi:hypothetical protein